MKVFNFLERDDARFPVHFFHSKLSTNDLLFCVYSRIYDYRSHDYEIS